MGGVLVGVEVCLFAQSLAKVTVFLVSSFINLGVCRLGAHKFSGLIPNVMGV